MYIFYMFYPEAWFGMKSKPNLEIKQDCQQRGKRGETM